MKIVLLLLSISAGFALANEPYVYPSNGQTLEQQKQDEFECYQWAIERSGFDPVNNTTNLSTADVSYQPQESASGGAGKSALGGAARGAAIAEVSDGDAGKGAATGAALGIFKANRMKQQQQAMEIKQKEAAEARASIEAEAQQKQLRTNYIRANSACLEGRGYTVR